MYRSFYGLAELPFHITPDPRYLHFTGAHREAFDHLLYGVRERKGFIVLTGEVGSGKTTLCRAMLGHLPPGVHTALVLNPSLTETQLLRAILADFGVNTRRRDRLGCIGELNAFLLQKLAAGNNVVLVIDEAQDLDTRVLEQVRLLNNLETDRFKLMQIILAGQPELDEKLARKDLRQLRQRIMVRARLAPLDLADTTGYIRHRLCVAGAKTPELFDAGAVRLIHRRSGGIPRIINTIADHAMMAGYVARKQVITIREVKYGLREMDRNR